MRTMFDSITPADIPDGSQLVAGYVDGAVSRWPDAAWTSFPGRRVVRISVLGNDADVLDVENGAASPDIAPGWAKRQRARGAQPTVYVNLSNEAAVRAAFDAAGEPQPLYWLAHYDNDATLPPGYVAKQYADSAQTGGHYDASVVADFWLGVDQVDTTKLPARVGQSADLTGSAALKIGTVAILAAAFDYGTGTPRWIERKVWAHRPGRFVVTIYPPVDPDADPTEHLDAEPAIFLVDVYPS